MSNRQIVVIGAGVAGLTAAYQLKQAASSRAIFIFCLKLLKSTLLAT